MKRSGFTMIELVFIIVILGILAAVAIPKMAASREDAKVVSIRQDIETITQAIPAMAMSQGASAVTKFADAVTLTETNWKPVNVGDSLATATAIYTTYAGDGVAGATSKDQSCLVISFKKAPVAGGNPIQGVDPEAPYLEVKAQITQACKRLGVAESEIIIPLTGRSIRFE
ncbi:MAG: type II secretion system protein [Wolinella sp.]